MAPIDEVSLFLHYCNAKHQLLMETKNVTKVCLYVLFIGYFYHIGTIADVHDYVQDYVRIMARPLVVDRSRHYAWSGVHVNVPVSTTLTLIVMSCR